MSTPVHIIQKQRLRILAELEYQAEQEEDFQKKRADQEREWQRQKQQQRRGA